MASAARGSIERSLAILRVLPRINIGNLRDNPGAKPGRKRGRGQHGGDTHGCGTKGSGGRQNYMRLGYETGNNPFYLRVPKEPYYQGHHLRRQYPPLSLFQLQRFIDLGRVDPTLPIDLTAISNTKEYEFYPEHRHFGVNLTDEGLDNFKSKVNIEVQWASESVIAAVERQGGVITTAYYDMACLRAVKDPLSFFKRGIPIPRRMFPPQDALAYYADPKNRGYLADPQLIARERQILAQKYGYDLPDLEKDPQMEMLTSRKDPRQVFLGLEPGWVVCLKDKCILKPKDEMLKEFYSS